MYARREKQAGAASSSTTAAATGPGRGTLAEQLAGDEHEAPRRPSGIQWPTEPSALAKTIDEPRLPEEERESEHEESDEGEAHARAAQAPASGADATGAGAAAPATTQAPVPKPPDPPPPPDAAQVMHGDDPAALERIYGDNHKHAHKAPFEQKHAHAEKHHPKHDKFNRKGVKSDKTTNNVAGRPGAVTHHGGKTDGIFELVHETAIRYVYVRHGDDNVAEPYDVIDRKKLAPHNFKTRKGKVKDQDKQGRKQRLLLNPAQPRKLLIGGKHVMCVLSWVDGETAAWLPLDDIKGGDKFRTHLLHSVKARATKWDPSKVSGDPQKILKQAKRYVFRNDGVGQSTSADDGPGKDDKHPRVLGPGATKGDNVEHYLNKDIRKQAFDEDGKPIGKNVTRSVVAVCMNLPGPHVPPVAIDTAEAGQSFFVMRSATFHRRVPVFENGKKHSNLLQTWVFGHLSMRDAGGKLVPDPNRRGWVPLRVLAEASDLQTRDIPQRIP